MFLNMHLFKVFSLSLLVAGNLPSAMGEEFECAAIGHYYRDGAMDLNTPQWVEIYDKDGNKWWYTDQHEDICAGDGETYSGSTMNWPHDLNFDAHCANGKMTGCSGNSMNTYIKGEMVSEGDMKFYGINSAMESSCKLKIPC
ncbi:hypothetical protein N7492_006584 [Penicillium capsulatum]|uniref:Uncharacterized protein n=1 Tax=Penicillium capsulatum TaxID=69766 RepID=A0A9W9LJW7_9EURO|nr:hypothetical protein N7492_006584 [Penicillium capsulatum]KAJ6116419.1 hypothetical protein N7512_006144 [Penicillium capsulatum]